MAIALVAHVPIVSAGLTGGTSAAIITTGATGLYFAVASYIGFTPPTVSDSKINTWVPRTVYSGVIARIVIFYCENPVVGSGHTFTIAGGTTAASGCIAAFSGTLTASSYDVESGADTGGSPASAKPGSATPSGANELAIAAVCVTTTVSGALAVDSGFTITDEVTFSTGVREGCGLAYLIQTTATAENPSFSTFTGAGFDIAVAQAFFKPSGSPPAATVKQLAALGVG